MPLGFWFYVATPEGRFEAVSARRWQDFCNGESQLPATVRGRVRYAQVIVENEDRTPRRLFNVGFYEIPLTTAGTADRLRLARAATRLLEREGGENFTWTPTDRATAELNAVINRRAKARLANGPVRFAVVEGGRRRRRR
jgi:hypothetical protein